MEMEKNEKGGDAVSCPQVPVNIIRFLSEAYRRNIGWKIVSCDRMTVPQLLLQQPVILKNH